ncbi:hypothetical protein Cal7507_0989 [Calothrix sp. PCC 7507]|nr:hypothetical protein Cal7507_0989 [Calothrix sp. PCC 7507]
MTYCLLPIAYDLLPIAYCLLPIAYCLPKQVNSEITEELFTAIASKCATITPDMPYPALVVEVVSPGKVNEDRDYRYKRSESVNS